MKKFYGETFINKTKLKEASIYNPIKLEYYKIESKENTKEAYGIEVVKTEYKQGNILVERKTLDEITSNENVANNILELFKRNEVTPISADEIIEDLFSK